MYNKLLFLYFILCLDAILTISSAYRGPEIPSRCLIVPGDLNLGLLTGYYYNGAHPHTEICRKKVEHFAYHSLLYYEAFIYAINNVNSRNDILPNISLGYAIHDTCWSELGALAKAQLFVPQEKSTCMNPSDIHGSLRGWSNCSEGPIYSEVVGVVDPPSSAESKRVTQLLGLYGIPVLSTRATHDELSDKSRYPYFTRLSPPDSMMIRVLFDWISYFNWTYISILYPDSQHGSMQAREVLDVARSRNICVPVSQRVPFFPSTAEAARVADMLKKHSKARMVINFLVDVERFAIYDALDRCGMTGHFIWLSGDILIGSNDGPRADGSIVVIPYFSESRNFTSYFQAITPESRGRNPWVQNYWEYYFNCSNKQERSCDQYRNSTILSPKHRSGATETLYIEAVEVYAHALHDLISESCPQAFLDKNALTDCIRGHDLLQYIRNVSIESQSGIIKFTNRGDRIGKFLILQYTSESSDLFTEVGMLDQIQDEFIVWEDKINWKRPGIYPGHPSYIQEGDIPISICSAPCTGRDYPIRQELHCCWECLTCPLNHKLSQNPPRCDECPAYQWPDEHSASGCSSIEPIYLNWTDPCGIIFSGISVVGLILSLSTAIWMYRHRYHKLVKACSVHLSGILLFGTGFAFATTFPHLMKPTRGVCLFRHHMFNMAIGLMFVPLFVKSVRVYRIFQAGKKGVTKVKMVSNGAQMILTVGLLLILVSIFNSISYVYDYPKVSEV